MVLPAHAQFDTFGGDPSTNAFIRIPADTDDWTRHFRLGALVGMNISANFTTHGTFTPSGNPYSDGYVRPDASGDKTDTANWGYTSASQYNSSTGNLTMTGVNDYTASGSSHADGGPIPGLDMAYGGNLWYWKHARVGWELGFGWLPIDITSSQTTTAQVSQSTAEFSTGGIILPEAPYTGSANGIGPLIPLNPTSTPLPVSQETLNGKYELNVDLYTLRLGPSFYWDVTDRVGMSLGAGPAVGLVDGNYKYSEVIQTGTGPVQSNGRISATDFTFGGYVNATLMYHLVANGDLYLGAEYMPMENTTISGGGRSGELDLHGQVYISAGINWPF
jgi:hypothetical protein